MPEPIPDLRRDQQCHHYQAPTGERCGSPALKGEYYCYHHHLKHAKRADHVLIDPEITRMELPAIEDRASIFVALAAVLHRLAENTIDTRRSGQMIYGLQVCLQALPPAPVGGYQHVAQPDPEPESELEPTPAVAQPTTNNQQPTTPAATPDSNAPATIPISKQALLYFLRSRHCAHCNAELFPASQLTERRNPGAPPEVIPEARPALPAPQPATVLPSLQAVAESDLPPSERSHAAPGRILPSEEPAENFLLSEASFCASRRISVVAIGVPDWVDKVKVPVLMFAGEKDNFRDDCCTAARPMFWTTPPRSAASASN